MIMMRQIARTVLALGVAALAAAPAAAQPPASPAPAFGWTLTPAFAGQTTWDDNALIRNGNETPSDLVNVVNPRLRVEFKGRRGDFTAAYDSAFQMYRELSTLNSYDQHASVGANRLLSPHVSLTGGYEMAVAPSTESLELIGIPFVRVGSRNQSLRGGVEAALSKRTLLSATYKFQVVHFKESQLLSVPLAGGHSHGAAVTLRRALSARTSLTADYDVQRAHVGDVVETFNVHRAEGGVEHRPSDRMRLFGAVGLSRLLVGSAAARTGPSWRAGLTHAFQTGTVDVVYSRSFVPSYGFGGTQQNEELTARTSVPLSESLYTSALLSLRFNEPLTAGGPKLRRLSIRGSLGYRLAPWAGVEGFYDSTAQVIDIDGGRMDRRRVGVQIVTTKPMRIR
jgi:hypothetical protein